MDQCKDIQRNIGKEIRIAEETIAAFAKRRKDYAEERDENCINCAKLYDEPTFTPADYKFLLFPDIKDSIDKDSIYQQRERYESNRECKIKKLSNRIAQLEQEIAKLDLAISKYQQACNVYEYEQSQLLMIYKDLQASTNALNETLSESAQYTEGTFFCCCNSQNMDVFVF